MGPPSTGDPGKGRAPFRKSPRSANCTLGPRLQAGKVRRLDGGSFPNTLGHAHVTESLWPSWLASKAKSHIRKKTLREPCFKSRNSGKKKRVILGSGGSVWSSERASQKTLPGLCGNRAAPGPVGCTHCNKKLPDDSPYHPATRTKKHPRSSK